MTSEAYFYDQSSRASHRSGIRRSKRTSKDLNQALQQSKVASTFQDNRLNKSDRTIFTSDKKQTAYGNLQTILCQLNPPIIPELIIKDLDTILKRLANRSKTTSKSPNPSEPNTNENEDQLTNPVAPKLPGISLPSSLIVRLHSTWSDLIANTEYKYKTWQTKASETVWREYVQGRRSELIKDEKRQSMNESKTAGHHRKSSRISISSGKNLLHRQSLIPNTQRRTSRPYSRGSVTSTGDIIEENLRLLKSIHQDTTENTTESHRNGIHVEFKLSTQLLNPVQNNQTRKQQCVLFDVQQSGVNFNEEMILLTQNKCKRLLVETKQKILATTTDFDFKHLKTCRFWFYNENQFIRNKASSLLTDADRRQKSKFILSILRREIPEKYNIDIVIPENKHKCYIELIDGSSQIYYPSGHLAVLRLRSPFSTTLFFDDTAVTSKQVLGLVTSMGNVVLMQPALHARFVTNNQHEYAYLCNGQTGVIEKQLQWYSTKNCRRKSLPVDDNNLDVFAPENTVQFQLNSYMQLEYNNPSNIRFAFTCENEEFRLQLGLQSPTTMDITTTAVLAAKRLSGDKKSQMKRTSSIISNDMTNVSDKQQIQSQKSTDEQVDYQQLPIMKELILLRKRIRNICDSWLKEYRTTLDILDVDAYCLSDLPPSPSQQASDDIKQIEYVPILTKRTSLNIESLAEQQLLRHSPKLSTSNILTNSIELFIPHSDLGRRMKKRISSEKKMTVSTLPLLK